MVAVASQSTESFAIDASVDGNGVSLKLRGTGDLIAVQPMKEVLTQVQTELMLAHHGHVIFDIRELYLLNSTCLKLLVSFIYQIQSRGQMTLIRFVVAPRLTWQRRTLAALERMAPELVTIEGS